MAPKDASATYPSARTASIGSPVPFSQPAWHQGASPSGSTSARPQTAPSPGLSQSYDQRSMQHQQMQQQQQQTMAEAPKRPEVSPFSAKLSTSVDAAISNVDRALYEMQSREIERLRAKLDAVEKRGGSGDDEYMAKHAATVSAPIQHAVSSPDKRRTELLEKQIIQLKQDKQVRHSSSAVSRAVL